MIIRCPIHGSIHLDHHEKRVINHPYFQRLRHIQQLGLGHYVYPGAVHSRFSHSLGCFHLAAEVFEQLLKNPQHGFFKAFSQERLGYFKVVVRLAALLHDVGHAPLSHGLEFLFPKRPGSGDLGSGDLGSQDSGSQDLNSKNLLNHEDFTLSIIQQLAQEKNPVLSPEQATGVAALISKKEPKADLFCAQGVNIFPLLSQLINSDADADRMDYLLRDAYYTGVAYGNFDLPQLSRSLLGWQSAVDGKVRLALHHSALTTYEHFVWARACMFVQVYFHKSLAGFVHFFKQAIIEKELQLSIPTDLDEYLRLTDHQVYQILETAQAKPGARWTHKIWHREPAKVLLRVINPTAQQISSLKQAQKKLDEAGIYNFNSSLNNSFSKQNEQLNDTSIGVLEYQFSKPKIYLLGQKSQLLRSAQKNIVIQQISTLQSQKTAALECLAPLLTEIDPAPAQKSLSFGD